MDRYKQVMGPYKHARSLPLRTLFALLMFWPTFWLYGGTQQTITFSPILQKTTADVPFTLSATASSSLPVSFSIVSPAGVAAVSGSLVSLSGLAGAVTVKATQGGNVSYDPAPDVFQTFVVGIASQRFVSIACGSWHTVGIRADGTLWAWGENLYGQLGDGTTINRLLPVQVGSNNQWSKVFCGGSQTFAIRTDGTLWAWGRNNNGQLGDGSLTTRLSPVQIGIGSTWSQVSSSLHFSTSFTMAIKTDGTLWAWGGNNLAQLGIGSYVNQLTPVRLGSATNWSQVSCNGQFDSAWTAAIKSDGSLWTWGSNGYGQLGDGTTTSRLTPTRIGTDNDWSSVDCGTFYYSMARKTNGSLWGWGFNQNYQLGIGSSATKTTPTRVGSASNWVSFSCGYSQVCALASDGTLWTWGTGSPHLGNGIRQSAIPMQFGSVSNWSQVSIRSLHVMALRTDGSLWSWSGGNTSGERGDGSMALVNLPKPCGTGTNWRIISGGAGHSAAIKNDGSLWLWGAGDSGQLGNNDLGALEVPTQLGVAFDWADVDCGGASTLAIKTNGTLWGWGNNFYGQLGDGTTAQRTSPVRIGSSTNWAKIECNPYSSDFALAIKTDGTLWAWGNNDYGKLGIGNTLQQNSPVQVGSDNQWASVAAGDSHVVALKKDGSLWAWGQIGPAYSDTPVQVGNATDWIRIACGVDHALAIKSDGTLWSWGGNSQGQLGLGTTITQNAPAQVGGSADWSRIGAGRFHSAAKKADGSIWTWGFNYYGELGDGTYVSRTIPTQIGMSNHWSDVACGAFHVIARTSYSTLWGWGSNVSGQLGIGASSAESRIWPPRSSQSISFSPLGPNLVVGQSATLNVTNTSGLPLTYFVDGAANFVGDTITTLSSPGTLVIAVYQEGAAAWLSAEPAIQVVSILSQETALLVNTLTAAGLSGPNATATAIPYHDGVSNLLKYAFNMSLTSSDSSVMSPGGTGGLPFITTAPPTGGIGSFSFEFLRRRNSGVIYAPQKSSDLSNPASWTPLSSTPAITTVNSNWERVVYDEPYDAATTPRQFGRVRVTLP